MSKNKKTYCGYCDKEVETPCSFINSQYCPRNPNGVWVVIGIIIIVLGVTLL